MKTPKFLIYIAEPYGIPIGRPLQKELLKRGFEIAWFSEIESTKKEFLKTDLLLHTVEDVKTFKPDVVLVATNEVPDFFPGIKVQIFHGFSVSKRSDKKGHFRIRGFFDLYCTQGPSTTLPFLELKAKHKYFDVVETGWSKVDPLFPITNAKRKKPTIIISSTFTSRLSLAKNDTVFNEIKRLSKLDKWRFVSILHPKMELEVVEKFKSLENSNFKFYDTTDVIPLFKQADIMFADTTSAITEFVLQKKPVVTFNNNKPKSYMINILEVSEIENALESALTRPQEIIDDIERFIKDTHPYIDGKSSSRIIEVCLNFLKNNRIKRKPLNLIRKYKIRKKLNYKKWF
jgi:CDP-glycerol glycerophosphotransferase (TagB/SpsB family)